MPQLMFHTDCGELLDKMGWCPKCRYPPSKHATAFREVDTATLTRDLQVAGRSFLGQFRVPIERQSSPDESDEEDA